LRLLARREHSRTELRRKLASRAESSEALERLLDELAHKKQLSNERYAEARARQLARKYGAARIAHDLRAKGIDDETAAGASAGAGGDEVGRAREILRRKYASPAATREELARRARFLQSRGFSYEVIRRVVIID